MKKKVSIIVRTKNEERWISRCLSTIFSQAFTDFEVIIVDNKSSDKTMEKAKNFRIKHIIHYKEDPYLPGKALNMGIQKSEGEFIVCLSGHCIPKDDEWLGKLVKNFYKEDGKLDSSIAGVYGRQEPFSSTSDSDKRDLALVFGLDRKVQEKDSFFHNANSMVRKDAWNDINFDEKVTNIEDRVWAGEVLKKGYKIMSCPKAIVEHKVAPRDVPRSFENFHFHCYMKRNHIYMLLKNEGFRRRYFNPFFYWDILQVIRKAPLLIFANLYGKLVGSILAMMKRYRGVRCLKSA